MVVILFLLGLGLIVKGGDLFVDAAAWMAEASGMPPLLIGATVVSIATTLPEQLVSFLAAAQGRTEMAVGNAVGSVTANTGLILALSVLLLPAAVSRRELGFRGIVMALSAVLLFLFCQDGKLALWESAILLLLFACFFLYSIRSAMRQNTKVSSARPKPARRDVRRNGFWFLVGAAALAVGSHLLVENGAALAAALGVPERIISVTLIAVGTSLPELVTAITALVKGQASLSVGNIFGANTLDLTLIAPICALLSRQSLPVTRGAVLWDLPFCAAEAILAAAPALLLRRFTRFQGAAMLALYLAYLGITLLSLSPAGV